MPLSLGLRLRDVWRVKSLHALVSCPCLQIIDAENNELSYQTVSSYYDEPPSSLLRFVWTAFAICILSRSVSLLSLCQFSFKLGEKLSPMTHFNTMLLFHSSKDRAGRFSENVFKLLSKRYVAAIKPAACVHSLLSSCAHVCAVASPLLQP